MGREVKARVFLQRMGAEPLEATISRALEFVRWHDLVQRGSHVAVKPNLTYPWYKPGVTTSPAFLEAVIRVLRTRTDKISVIESDGGSFAWTAEEAFEGHGLTRLAAQYNVALVNLTALPRAGVTLAASKGRTVRVELPAFLMTGVDVFVTLPVPKIHAMTGVSLGFKNQWGCIPDPKRLRLHPYFDRLVVEINRILKPRLAIYDGTYFLDGNGPMDGSPRRMDLVLATNDVGAGDMVCCAVMGIRPFQIGHLRVAHSMGMMPRSLEEIVTSDDVPSFQANPKFRLRRTAFQWVALGLFHSSLGTRVVYDSRLARPIHTILYSLRGAPKDFRPSW